MAISHGFVMKYDTKCDTKKPTEDAPLPASIIL